MLYLPAQDKQERRGDQELGLDSALSCNGKESAHTNYQSTGSFDQPRSPGLKSQAPGVSQINSIQARKLAERLRMLKEKQLEMESTFQICIKNLEKEIAFREKSNAIIREQIVSARMDIEETKKDIDYIRDYLGRKKAVVGPIKVEPNQVTVKNEQKVVRKNRSGKLFKSSCLKSK